MIGVGSAGRRTCVIIKPGPTFNLRSHGCAYALRVDSLRAAGRLWTPGGQLLIYHLSSHTCSARPGGEPSISPCSGDSALHRTHIADPLGPVDGKNCGACVLIVRRQLTVDRQASPARKDDRPEGRCMSPVPPQDPPARTASYSSIWAPGQEDFTGFTGQLLVAALGPVPYSSLYAG
ncbi:hypothetical protein FA95DRAFT_741956 [Auriscalpium vulgare]|uniref:Uncharacterized protein n=1 Tax=Auriscalpium vulgare TaxID=40419 RepID=A0ACB8SB37_9AGAM|nr:hypothetical protein FA95DRAFT_741956 [Auriscalpium vulgare]